MSDCRGCRERGWQGLVYNGVRYHERAAPTSTGSTREMMRCAARLLTARPRR